jgi:hypothetical protein
MIKGLILNAGKISRDAAIMCIGIYAVVWATGQLKETFNPMAFHDEVLRAEARSKDLIATEIKSERSISAAEHREVMRAVSGIDERTKRMEGSLDALVKRIPSLNAGLKFHNNNNRN